MLKFFLKKPNKSNKNFKILDGLTLKRTQFEHFSRNLGDVSLDNLNLLNEKANLSFHCVFRKSSGLISLKLRSLVLSVSLL